MTAGPTAGPSPSPGTGTATHLPGSELARTTGRSATQPSDSVASSASGAVDPRAAATMVLLCALWALGQIAIKLGNEGISPMWQAGMRSAGAAALVVLWMLVRGIPLASPPGIAPYGWLIGIAFGVEFACFYVGMALTTAARATVLIYTAPFFVAVGAHLLLGDRLNATRIAGLVLALGGVAVAMSDRGGPAGGSLAGDLLCLAAGFLWAVTTLIVKATPMRTEQPERTLLWQLWVSALVLFGASWLHGEAGVFAPTPTVWFALAYQTMIVASATYLAWFMLVQRFSAASLSAFTFMTPLFGVGFAALLLGEPLTVAMLTAAALIAAGIFLVNRR
jgi:drug/metabolite transporter (DMT)-like permease